MHERAYTLLGILPVYIAIVKLSLLQITVWQSNFGYSPKGVDCIERPHNTVRMNNLFRYIYLGGGEGGVSIFTCLAKITLLLLQRLEQKSNFNHSQECVGWIECSQ